MINLLNVFLIGSYNAFYSGVSSKSDNSSLVNIAKESFNNTVNVVNHSNSSIFENRSVSFNEPSEENSYIEINTISFNSLVNPTTSTVVDSFDLNGLVPDYSSNKLIQLTTTTATDGLDVHTSTSTSGLDDLEEEYEYDAEVSIENDSILKIDLEENENAGKKDLLDSKECTLTTYVAPQHAFLNLECQTNLNYMPSALSEARGFYPLDGGFSARLVANSAAGHLLGRELGDIGGVVAEEEEYLNKCDQGMLPCAKADFSITREQANTALKYIEDTNRACDGNDFSKCSYNLLGRNCVNFVEDTATAAGITDIYNNMKVSTHPGTPVFKQQLMSLAGKAWKYIYLKTWGKVNLQDSRDI